MLERLNRVAAEEFTDLTAKTTGVANSIQQIQEKSKTIKPCLDEIDVLEASTSELLNTAQLLDDYSKRVGKQVDLPFARFAHFTLNIRTRNRITMTTTMTDTVTSYLFSFAEAKYKELMMARRST